MTTNADTLACVARVEEHIRLDGTLRDAAAAEAERRGEDLSTFIEESIRERIGRRGLKDVLRGSEVENKARIDHPSEEEAYRIASEELEAARRERALDQSTSD